MNESDWPENNVEIDIEIPERKKIKLINLVASTVDNDIISQYSTLHKLKKITAYILRFINNLRAKISRNPFITKELSAAELN